MKKLYLITVVRGQSFYVIASSSTDAETFLRNELDKADWWFSDDRIAKDIKVLAEEIGEYPDKKPRFGNKIGDLIIK